MAQQNNKNNNNRRSQNKSRYRNNKNKNNRRNRRGNRNGNRINLDPVFKKFTNLMDEMIAARKKYFESFYKADDKRKIKLESIYVEKVKVFNQFQDTLKDHEKEKLLNFFPQLRTDTTYSENHGLLDHKMAITAEIVDPHLLETQKQSNFKEDTEESEGTLEDYKAYKGI